MVYFMYIFYLHLKRKYPCDILRRQNLKRVCHFFPRNIWHIKRRMIVHPGVLTVGIWIKCRWLNHVEPTHFFPIILMDPIDTNIDFAECPSTMKLLRIAVVIRNKASNSFLRGCIGYCWVHSTGAKNLLNFSTQKKWYKMNHCAPSFGVKRHT